MEGETFTAGQALSVTLSGAKIVRTFNKRLITILFPISRSGRASKDPTTKTYDFKRVETIFKITGKINQTSWEAAKQDMVNLNAMFEDGGTFTLNWRDEEYTVNVTQAIFTVVKPDNIIDYMINLRKATVVDG